MKLPLRSSPRALDEYSLRGRESEPEPRAINIAHSRIAASVGSGVYLTRGSMTIRIALPGSSLIYDWEV